MRTSAEGTKRYAEQRPEFRDAGFYRAVIVVCTRAQTQLGRREQYMRLYR